MKIVNRETFLSLPEGTVYCSYSSLGVTGELCIKQFSKDLKNDWYYSNLVGLDVVDSAHFVKCFEQLENGEELENSPCEIERDGMFDDGAMFLVLSKDDVRGIIRQLNTVLLL
jgi:hypothetical protein